MCVWCAYEGVACVAPDFFAMLSAHQAKEDTEDHAWTVEDDDDNDLDGSVVSTAVAIDSPVRWAGKFQHLLASEQGCKVFSKFLRTIFCDENMMFWRDSQDIRPLQDTEVCAKAVFGRGCMYYCLLVLCMLCVC